MFTFTTTKSSSSVHTYQIHTLSTTNPNVGNWQLPKGNEGNINNGID